MLEPNNRDRDNRDDEETMPSSYNNKNKNSSKVRQAMNAGNTNQKF